MRYLLDARDPRHEAVRDAVRQLGERRHAFVTGRQNVAEFWNVCTRPAEARGGFGLSVEEATRRLRIVERQVTVLGEPDPAYAQWKRLVVRHRVAGKRVHDARLAAPMIASRVRRILTLNQVDFLRYAPRVEAVTPDEVLAR